MFTLLYLVLLVCAIAQQQPTLRIALRHNDWIPIQPERACQVVRCLWTANHELNELSDLVITMHHMHDRHYRQYPGQLLAFLELEPPIHGSYGADARTSYERGFDWKIDYMKNSDVRLTYTPTTLQFDGGPYKTAVKDPRWLALAVISNCKDGDRLDYIEQMMRVPNMTILSVGKCLNTVNGSSTASLFPDCATDSRMQEKLCLMSKVFFQLAFENSRYDDYVTEKLFQTYDSHTIPVYRGAVNAQEMVPALHSTIFADDFGSPAALATFLVSLARNQTAYEDYFAWKRLGSSGLLPEFLKMQNSSLDNFQCNTCRTLQRWLEAKPEEFTRVPKRELELRRLLRLASDTSNVGNVVGNSSSNSSSSGTNYNNRAKSRAILLATVDRHGLANATRWIQSLLALPIPRPPFLLVALDNVTYSSLTTGSLASLTALPPLGPASSLSFRVVPFWLLLLVHTNFQDMDGAQDLQAMMLGDDGDNDGAALDLKARASSCLKPFVVSALLDQGYKVSQRGCRQYSELCRLHY